MLHVLCGLPTNDLVAVSQCLAVVCICLLAFNKQLFGALYKMANNKVLSIC